MEHDNYDVATFTGEMTVELLPSSTSAAVSYGSSCGPTLSGSPTFAGDFLLELAGADPREAGALLLGRRRAWLPIPGTACLLHTEPLVALPFAVDSRGNASHSLSSRARMPVDGFAQDIVFAPKPTGTTITASHWLQVSLR